MLPDRIMVPMIISNLSPDAAGRPLPLELADVAVVMPVAVLVPRIGLAAFKETNEWITFGPYKSEAF